MKTTIKIRPTDFKKNGYYLRKSIDIRKKQTMYEVAKDIDNSNRTILMELNRSAYLMCKNDLKMEVKVFETTFLNFAPYAHTNKESTPMYEYQTNNLNQ